MFQLNWSSITGTVPSGPISASASSVIVYLQIWFHPTASGPPPSKLISTTLAANFRGDEPSDDCISKRPPSPVVVPTPVTPSESVR